MKKFAVLFLSAAMVLSFTACGSKNKNNNTDNNANNNTVIENESNTDNGSDNNTDNVSADENEKNESENKVAITDALEILNTVWGLYSEEDMFPAAGGDFSEENSVTGGPGKYADEAEAFMSLFHMPEETVALIDDAASLTHMMNLNTFTCGAFHIASPDNVAAAVSAIKEEVLATQWMCGFPDKLMIATIDDYVISFFGKEDLVNKFSDTLREAYPTAAVACDEAII